MFEVITPYYIPDKFDEFEFMALRSELSFIIRSRNSDDEHQVSSIRVGDKNMLTLKYTNITDGQYLQDFMDSYITSDVIIYDKLEKDYPYYWLIDAIHICNIGYVLDGKLYYNLKDMEDDLDNIERYFHVRSLVLNRLKSLWDGKWMKDLGSYIKDWPIITTDLDNWYRITDHSNRIQGDFYTFYSNKIKEINRVRFRIPYNFTIIYHIALSYDIKVDGGFVTINDIKSYDEIKSISRTVEEAINDAEYKTVDYWGDNIGTIQPTFDIKIVPVKINSYQCYLCKIPNVISVDDGRKMVAHMLSDRIKTK